MCLNTTLIQSQNLVHANKILYFRQEDQEEEEVEEIVNREFWNTKLQILKLIKKSLRRKFLVVELFLLLPGKNVPDAGS